MCSRAVSTGNHDDSAVHLSSTGYHVLHIVGVSGAVYVSVVAVCGFVFYVCSVDGNTTLFFLGSVVNLVEGLHFGETLLGQHCGDSGGEGGFAVVNVADGANVDVGFSSFELLFCHNFAVIYY